MLEYRVEDGSTPCARLFLRGQLTGAAWADRLSASLAGSLGSDTVREIRVDLTGLDLIDLEGITVLLSLRAQSDQRGKRFSIHGATGAVRESLKLTGLLDLLESEGRGGSCP